MVWLLVTAKNETLHTPGLNIMNLGLPLWATHTTQRERIMKSAIIMGTVLFFSTLMSCISTGDITTREPGKNQVFSNAQKREVLLDHPMLLSGDYFRENSNPEEIKEPLPAKEMSHGQEQLGIRVANPGAAFSRSRSSFSPAKIKIGLFLNSKTVDAGSAMVIADLARIEAVKFPVVIVSAEETMELAAQSRCGTPSGDSYFNCLAKSLDLFPGIRMLLKAEEFSLPSTLPGTIRATISITDTFFSFTYLPMAIELPVKSKAEINSATSKILEKMFETALEKAAIMPWYCRSFSGDESAITINAGLDSGLNPDDLLTIRSPGRIIKAPSGLPAGWLPGKERGILRIETLFGRDLAACFLVRGELPRREDILTKQMQKSKE